MSICLIVSADSAIKRSLVRSKSVAQTAVHYRKPAIESCANCQVDLLDTVFSLCSPDEFPKYLLLLQER